MKFSSILYPRTQDRPSSEVPNAPQYFRDLNLDQIIAAMTAGRAEYELAPFFYAPLTNRDTIRYRQDVMRDLENPLLLEAILSFAHTMRTMREYLMQSQKLTYHYQKAVWFVDAVELYCYAVLDLMKSLAEVEYVSPGLVSFTNYLVEYIHSDRFLALETEAREIKDALGTVQYRLHIHGQQIDVHPYSDEPNYSSEVAEIFAKFKQGPVKQYRIKFTDGPNMNHVEAGILDFVAKLYPEIFAHLDSFFITRVDYLDKTLAIFDREIQFYIAVLDYREFFKQAGLPFCYPEISTSKEIFANDAFDAALAYQRIADHAPIVSNNFYLKDPERIFVVTGPNQGGKTTFARMFGQLHYLANLGCPVPGNEARLFLFDRLFTHFEKEETLNNHNGKLQDDLIRMQEILQESTPQSVVILNEIFTSTTWQDALFLSNKVMAGLCKSDLLGVWVTFIDDLASFNEKTVSLVSTVVPDNPAVRTYKILRRPPDGLSFALSIAEKYRMTYDWLKERIL